MTQYFYHNQFGILEMSSTGCTHYEIDGMDSALWAGTNFKNKFMYKCSDYSINRSDHEEFLVSISSECNRLNLFSTAECTPWSDISGMSDFYLEDFTNKVSRFSYDSLKVTMKIADKFREVVFYPKDLAFLEFKKPFNSDAQLWWIFESGVDYFVEFHDPNPVMYIEIYQNTHVNSKALNVYLANQFIRPLIDLIYSSFQDKSKSGGD